MRYNMPENRCCSLRMRGTGYMEWIGKKTRQEKEPARREDWFFWVAVILLIITAFFRLWDLGTTPPGLTNDELANAEISSWLREGYVSIIYDEVQPAREFVYYSLLSAFTAIVGEHGVLLWRLPSVWISLLTLALTARLMRSLFNERIALLILGMMAVLFWPVWLGRSVLHVTLVPLMTTLFAYAVMRAMRAGNHSTSALWFTFSAFILGAAQYVHVICWALIPIFFVYLLYRYLLDHQFFKEKWMDIIYMLALTLVIMLPLFIYLSSNPGVRDRVPLSEQPGLIAELPGRLIAAIAGLGLKGDMLPWHNLPGRPVLGPLSAVLFLFGLGISIARWRKHAYMTALLWLAFGLLPSLALPQKSDFEYMAIILPVIFVFPSIALYELFLLVNRKFKLSLSPNQIDMIFGSIAGLIILINMGWTFRDFFIIWPERADVQTAYNGELGALAHYLDTSDEVTPVAICTRNGSEGGRRLSPTNEELLGTLMHRIDLPVRYFDCQRSLLLLEGGAEQRIIFPRGHFYDLPGPLQPWMNTAEDIGINHVGEGVALQLDVEDEVADFAGGLMTLSPTAWPPEIGEFRLARLPIRFGYNLAFLGYDLRNPELKPGDYVEVVTYWRMDGPPPPDLKQFTHVLGSPFVVLAQNDGMGTRIGSLRSRDIFMEYVLIQLPGTISGGYYSLSTGMYFPDTGERLPAFEEDNFIADRLYIEQIYITR